MKAKVHSYPFDYAKKESEWLSERAQLVRALRNANRRLANAQRSNRGGLFALLISLMLNLFVAAGLFAVLLF